VVFALVAVLGTGCMAHVHTVGLGATSGEIETSRQYYWLFGFIDINEVDTERMAGDLTSYSVETSYGFVDFVLMPLLLPLLATSRTVVVRT